MFGLVIEENAFNPTFDAIVGLAYKEFAEPGVIPFFDSLMDSGTLSKKVFAFHMSMNPDDEESELVFGNWDESRFEGDLVWHDVKHKLFWSITLDDILIDGKSLGYCGPDSGKTCYLTPDSGTSLLTFPSWAHKQFMKDYGDEKDCDEGDEYDYGDITYVVNGTSYTLPSHHWMQREKNLFGKGYCSPSVQMLDVGQKGLDDLFIAGDMFMQLYYTVFDRDRDKIGMAKAVHSACEKVYHFNTSGAVDYIDERC